MNILIKAGGSIPFNRKVQSTELFRDPESILMLAQFLGGVMGNNVVVCASTGGFCHEGPAYVIVDSSFFDGCLENNRWDVYISVGDPSMTTHGHPMLNTSLKIEWSDWVKLQCLPDQIPEDVVFVARSEFHKRMLSELSFINHPVEVIYDAVNPPEMGVSDKSVMRFYYPGGAINGLHHMYGIWPAILKQEPEARLEIPAEAVDFCEKHKYSHFIEGERARKVMSLLKMDGVEVRENDDGSDMYFESLSRCQAVIYPCDPIFPSEISLSLLSNSISAGVPVVCSDRESFKELPSDEGSGVAVLPVELPYESWADIILGSPQMSILSKGSVLDLCGQDRVLGQWLDLIQRHHPDFKGEENNDDQQEANDGS